MLLLCGIKSLGKNVNHCTAKKVLFAAATNKKSAIKQKLQESGAEIYQIPTFKKKEYTVTSEQINKILTLIVLYFVPLTV